MARSIHPRPFDGFRFALRLLGATEAAEGAWIGLCTIRSVKPGPIEDGDNRPPLRLRSLPEGVLLERGHFPGEATLDALPPAGQVEVWLLPPYVENLGAEVARVFVVQYDDRVWMPFELSAMASDVAMDAVLLRGSVCGPGLKITVADRKVEDWPAYLLDHYGKNAESMRRARALRESAPAEGG